MKKLTSQVWLHFVLTKVSFIYCSESSGVAQLVQNFSKDIPGVSATPSQQVIGYSYGVRYSSLVQMFWIFENMRPCNKSFNHYVYDYLHVQVLSNLRIRNAQEDHRQSENSDHDEEWKYWYVLHTCIIALYRLQNDHEISSHRRIKLSKQNLFYLFTTSCFLSVEFQIKFCLKRTKASE